MPSKCLLVLLDGLGDRAHKALDGRTPLQAAATPTFDALAASGGNGLYHAGLVGQAMPSELAHFLLFGFPEADFPGRGALEALGAGIELAPLVHGQGGDAAFMARFVCARLEGKALQLIADTPQLALPEETAALAASLPVLELEGLKLEQRHIKGLHGVLLLRGVQQGVRPSPDVTDVNPIRNGAMLIAPRPLVSAGNPEAASRSARALQEYLGRAYRTLDVHPVNKARREKGLFPLNFLATQRGGQLRPLIGFRQRHGLHAASIASGGMYKGLAACLGMDYIQGQSGVDPGVELSARLEQAENALQTHDFVHLHTKAPDVAAHTKDCLRKRDVIAALDKGAGRLLQMAKDPDLLLVITADHSTPSSGSLIHSGEPVPLLLHGDGVRRDAVERFDEVAAATGCLGLLRGAEFMLLLLSHLDRARLMGLRDSPEDFVNAPSWPARYEPFRLD